MFFLNIQYWGRKKKSNHFVNLASGKHRPKVSFLKKNPSFRTTSLGKFFMPKKKNFLEMNSNLCFSEIFSKSNIDFKRKGTSLMILCPFHEEKTPSFYADDEKGVFYCFGCGESGNIQTFLTKIKSTNSRANFPGKNDLVNLPSKSFLLSKKYSLGKRSRDFNLIDFEDLSLVQLAWSSYYHFLKNNKKIKIICLLRGFPYSSREFFGVGFALSQKKALFEEFLKKGVSPEKAVKSGLVYKKMESGNQNIYQKKGKIYYLDMFRERLIIPIRNSNGITIGFGGRSLNKKGFPKYINSSDWEIFKKKRILFSEDIMKKFPSKKPEVSILVEGYMDSFALFQNGIRFSIANLGIGISSYQLLRSGISNKNCFLIFFLDSDFSGKKAVQNFFWKFKNFLHSNFFQLGVAVIPDNYDTKDPDEFLYYKGCFLLTNRVLNFSTPILFWVEKIIFQKEDFLENIFEEHLDKIHKELKQLTPSPYFSKKFFLELNRESRKWEVRVKNFFLEESKGNKLNFSNNQKIFPGENFMDSDTYFRYQKFSGKPILNEGLLSLQRKLLILSIYFSKFREDLSQVCSPNQYFFFTSFDFFSQQKLSSLLFQTGFYFYNKIFVDSFEKEELLKWKKEKILKLVERKLGIKNFRKFKGKNEELNGFLVKIIVNFFEIQKINNFEKFQKLIFLEIFFRDSFSDFLRNRKNKIYTTSTLNLIKKRKKDTLKHHNQVLSQFGNGK